MGNTAGGHAGWGRINEARKPRSGSPPPSQVPPPATEQCQGHTPYTACTFAVEFPFQRALSDLCPSIYRTIMSSLFLCLKCLCQNLLFSSNHYTWNIFPLKSSHIQLLFSTAISSIPASFPLCTGDENSGLSALPNHCKDFLANLPASSFLSSNSSPRMLLESLNANLIASLHYLQSSNIPTSYRFKPNDIIMAHWGIFILFSTYFPKLIFFLPQQAI